MIRMFTRLMSSRTVVAGTDMVVVGLSLPSGSVVHDVNFEVHMQSGTIHTFADAAMYAIEAWIIPVLDPDSGSQMDVVFDRLVPKDTDTETIDLDTASSITTPFFEPGEPDFSDLMDVGLRPERIYSRSTLLTMVNGSIFTFQDNQTPFAIEWIAGDVVRVRIKKRYRVDQPSLLVMAVASPSLDDTTTTPPTMLAEDQWGQAKYVGHVLERALLHLFGVVETGAETPWEEATALLKLMLEPDVFELDAGTFVPATWNVVARGIVDWSVVGEMGKVALSSGR